MSDESETTRLIETVERDAWLDLFDAAPARTAARLGMASARQRTLGLLATRAIPITECNRIMALGAEAPAGEALLEEAADWLERHGSRAGAVQLSPLAATAETLAWLKRRGMAPAGNGWTKFHLDASAAPASWDPAPATPLDVRLVGREGADDFGRTAQGVFGFPPTAAAWIGAVAGRPGWRAYVVYDGAAPVATAAMFVRAQAAWLGVATTVSPFRRRGAQSALIARRVADGLAEGVTCFTAETAYPGEGGRSSSFNNFRRAGFGLAYVRPNYKLLE